MTAQRRGIVTLTSDFGEGSPYVAAMKAAVLRAAPEVQLVDVSHSIPPFDVASASFVLWAATREFPEGTVHLAVVDPGVGSDRRAVAVQLGHSFWVGPDNGQFTMLLNDARPLVPASVVLKRPASASATFEGRDVFAPAAGALAAGRRLRDLGEEAGPLVRLPDRGPRVLWVDRFGNLVTNLRPPVAGLKVGSVEVRRQVRTYSDHVRGGLFVYPGSLGLLEVGVREGRADVLLNAGPGTPVHPLR